MPYEHSGQKKALLDTLRYFGVLAMLATILFSLLNLNSYFIILVLFLTLIDGNWKQNLYKTFTNPVFVSFLLIFLTECLGLLYNHDMKAGLKKVESSAGLIAIPFMLITGRQFFSSRYISIMKIYCILLLISTLICIGYASYQYQLTNNIEVFFYHELLRPINHHAVYFSVFLNIGIVYLISNGFKTTFIHNRKTSVITSILITWFFCFVLLLASKLMIVATILIIIVLLAGKLIRQKNKALLLTLTVASMILMMVLLTIDNPIKKRFTDIFTGNAILFREQTFTTNTYFNGLQFRLLIWKFGTEIIREKNAIVFGVSPGDAQMLLNEKYRQANMYLGDVQRKDKGYLNYNFHNQFIQSLVESGLTGLLLLAVNVSILFYLILNRYQRESVTVMLLIFLFFLTESVLERQYGIFLFTFFPLFQLYRLKSNDEDLKR